MISAAILKAGTASTILCVLPLRLRVAEIVLVVGI